MKLLVVSRYAVSKKYRPMLGLPADVDVTYFGVGRDETGEELTTPKLMRAHFLAEGPHGYDAILALGNEGLHAVTGHSGIMTYRGRDLDTADGTRCVASISPAAIERTPSLKAMLASDIASLLQTAIPAGVVPVSIRYVQTEEDLSALRITLAHSEAVAFDLETTGFDEFAHEAFIVSIALTVILTSGETECWAVPLGHPAADLSWYPDNGGWQALLQELSERMCKVPVRVGHNAKFDCRWLVGFGAPVPCNFDTMLAAHMLDENRPKSLKMLARMLLGAPEWDIQIDDGKNAPPWYEQHQLPDILRYNALDTWHTMRLYQLFGTQMEQDPRVSVLFHKLMMPASQSLVHIERNKIYVDTARLHVNNARALSSILACEEALARFVPEDCPHKVNWNPSNFLKWLLFEHMGYPVIKYTAKGAVSVDESVMQELVDQGHELPKILMERTTWEKLRSTYFTPYLEQIGSDSRLGTTFKLAGTVTGRMASGKPDADKIRGTRGIRGINAQNVPRNKLVRGLFSAPPGWKRVDADYSQLELRLAAEVAQERNMLRMYQQGRDLHMEMAMRMTGKVQADVTYEERSSAKPVNFGFLYAMGWERFIIQSKADYGITFTEVEAQTARKVFFQAYPDLRLYHQRQRKLAQKYKRVQTPLGRIRHLPDIDSPNQGVMAEAERQAINSPIQGMGSDLCLLSICLLHRKFSRAKMRTIITNNVHDSIGFEIPDEELDEALPMIKHTMEHLPLEQLFGYEMQVPLVADLSVGTHWGEQKEITL